MALTKITTDSIDLSSDTTGLKIPKGTTAERPAGGSSTTGQIRENTDTGNVEVYNGGDWRALQQTGQDTGVVGTNNFDTIIYSNSVSTPAAITGLNFQPDLTWVKSRSWAYPNILGDSVRGLGDDKMLITDFNGEEGSTAAEANCQKYGYISSLDINGFGVTSGTGAGSNGSFVGANGSGDYVSWSWKAGGSGSDDYYKDGTGYGDATSAGMNAGTITPTGSSVNTQAGFSIVAYTGTGTADSFSHGLGNVPDCIIIKKLDTGTGNRDWVVYHKDLTSATYEIYLNRDISEYNSAGAMFASTPTSAVVNIGNDDYINESAISYIAYSWRSIPGYSLIGGYRGSGLATDTPIIYTGFKPAWIMVKRTDSTGDWNIVDDKRSTADPRTIELAANEDSAETTPGNLVNFDDEGFQIITTDTGWNAENGDYIFMCFAS